MEENENKKEVIEIQKENTNQNTNQATQNVQETKKDKKGFCIASMVLGIVALVLFCVWYLSIPCGILAIVFGILGLKSTNKPMAITGLVTGSIGLVISVFILIGLFIFGMAIGFSDAFDNSTYHRSYYDYNLYE